MTMVFLMDIENQLDKSYHHASANSYKNSAKITASKTAGAMQVSTLDVCHN